MRRTAVTGGHHLNPHTAVRQASPERAPNPSVSSSGCAATTTISPQLAMSSSGASASASSQSCVGVPRTVNGRAANRAPLPTCASVIAQLPPAGPAVRGPARRGSAARTSSGRRRALHAAASWHSGAGPRARPVRVIVSSTAVSTTARVRRAINSAMPLRFNGSSSIATAAHESIASPAASAASTAPRCASVCGSAESSAARAYSGAATARAPPSQHAATPIAPCQKPGRDRYSPGRPTGMRGRIAELH